jgi:hypothetical protein
MGLSWFEANVSSDYKNTSGNSTTNSSFNGTSNTTGTQTGTQTGTGTYTPNLSDYWKNAYQSVVKSVGPNGATPEQQTAIDFINGQLKNSSAQSAVANGNNQLGQVNGGLSNIGNFYTNNMNDGSYTLGSLAAKAKAGVPGYESYAAPDPVSAEGVTAQSSASAIPKYQQFYDDSLINPSLNAYDYGTNRAFSALDARTAGAGGFANERSGLAYSDLGAQSALGRGNLYSSMKNLGLNNAAALATGDVTRALQADTTNAANGLSADQFNANMTNQRQQYDVGAAYQGDQMRMNYANAAAANLLQQAGISQQITQNLLTANGIDMNAASALFQSGAITYGQLQAIIQAAQAANGATTTNNQNSTQTGNSTTNTSGSGTSNTQGSSTTVGAGGSVGFK